MTDHVNLNNTSLQEHFNANSVIWDKDNAIVRNSVKPEHIKELRNDSQSLLLNLEKFIKNIQHLDNLGNVFEKYSLVEIEGMLNTIEELKSSIERELLNLNNRATLYNATDYNLAVVNTTNKTVDHDYSNDSANINILLIAKLVAITMMQGNSAAAKVTSEAGELYNRVLNALSALGELMAKLNEMYANGLTKKQQEEIKNGNSGSTSNTISWDDLIKNAQDQSGNGSQTPNNNYATFSSKDQDGNDLPTRGGFLIKSSSELLCMLTGMLGNGTFNYYDKLNTRTEIHWSTNPTTGKPEKVEVQVPAPQWKLNQTGSRINDQGYIFVDKEAMKGILLYVSQLVGLAIPSSSGNENGDLVANFGDAYESNFTVGSMTEGINNLIKQIQGKLAELASKVQLLQNNAQGGQSGFDSILQGVKSNLSMLGV